MTADAEPTSDPMVAFERLLAATERGEIDQLGERHGLDLLGVFGSVVRRYRDETTPMPRDLDISVSFTGQPRLLELVDDLVCLTGYEHVDVAVLNGASPVLGPEGLIGIGLYQRTLGGWATAQMAALAERRDTAHLRRLDLELLTA